MATDDQRDKTAYRVLQQLDRLEELLEEMDALGIESKDQLLAEMTRLNLELDQLSDD